MTLRHFLRIGLRLSSAAALSALVLTGCGDSGSSAIPLPTEDFTEIVGDVSFNMVYVPGGTFTLGCETESGCPANTAPVPGVTVSSYFIGEAPVTRALWLAVMEDSVCTASQWGFNSCDSPYTNSTWYDAMEFACKLSRKVGKKGWNYRMMTEAEFEYAAKNHRGSLTLGNNEEWAYNTWSATHMGGTNPVGPRSGVHDQKTRRNAQGTGDNVTGRLIRSIEGTGPALRLVLSANFPPDMVKPCDLSAPAMGAEPANSYRDKRWVTGGSARWTGGNIDLRVWDDGTATSTTNWGGRENITAGQWFTSNNITFVFVPNPSQGGFGPAPTTARYAYIFLDATQGSFLSDGGMAGRIAKEAANPVDKPAISNLMSGEDLAGSMADFDTYYKMVDMVNMPASARQQDERLLDGPDSGWLQINTGATHHYRKDVDLDEFRFVVSGALLANGSWFTVNNTFLRVTHSTGYTADYLYVVTSAGRFMHNSFMGYERGDFRMFEKLDNGNSRIAAIANQCSRCVDEIPKGQGASMYAGRDNGQSTFVPAPCPSGGCR